MSLINDYEDVLSGKRKLLPYGTWSEEGKENFKILIRYIFLEKLNLKRSKFCKQNILKLIKKYKLYGGITNVFKGKIHEAIDYSFPEWKLKEWEYCLKVPRDFWDDEKIIKATKWLIEEKLEWNKEMILNNLNIHVFRKYKLSSLHMMTGGIKELLEKVYPQEDWNGYNKGEYTRTSKYKEKEIKYILSNMDKKTRFEISMETGISLGTIHNIIHGDTWKYLTK